MNKTMAQANDNTPEPIDLDAMQANMASIRANAESLLQERAKLVAFAKNVMEAIWNGDSGYDIEKWAQENGLIVARPATETDIRSGHNADVGDMIAGWSPWMKAAIAKVER